MRCQSAFLPLVAAAVAGIRGETVERIRRLQQEAGLSMVDAIRRVAEEGHAK